MQRQSHHTGKKRCMLAQPAACQCLHLSHCTLTFETPIIFLAPIRFSQITKPRSKPLALEMNLARPQWRAVSTQVSIISLPVSSQAIWLKVLDACKLLTAAVNTSLKTLNRLANLIDDRGCEDVTGAVRTSRDQGLFSLTHPNIISTR